MLKQSAVAVVLILTVLAFAAQATPIATKFNTPVSDISSLLVGEGGGVIGFNTTEGKMYRDIPKGYVGMSTREGEVLKPSELSTGVSSWKEPAKLIVPTGAILTGVSTAEGVSEQGLRDYNAAEKKRAEAQALYESKLPGGKNFGFGAMAQFSSASDCSVSGQLCSC